MKIKSLVITAVLVTAFLCSAGFVSAQTTDNSALIAQLQAQIQSLLQQIATLQAQQGAAQAWCHNFDTNFGIGTSNSDLDALITVLNKENISEFNSANKPTQYNEIIAGAVSGLQQKYASEILTPNNLKYPTGHVGPATRKKLNVLYGCRGVRIPVNPTQPSITVISPNSGEHWKIGETHNITWNGTNIPLNGRITIQLQGPSADYLFSEINNTGSVSWTIPSTIQPGNYKIRVLCGQTGTDWYCSPDGSINSNQKSEDLSNNNFTITTAANAGPVITNFSTGGSYGTSESVMQGQSTVIGINGSNFTGVDNTLCGVNSSALNGISITRCVPGSTSLGLVVNVSANATLGDRQLTVTTPNGTSNAVTLTVLSSSVNRSLIITSPNGGEAWKFGETHRITWTSQGIDKVSIAVYNDTIYGSGSTNYLDFAGTSLSVPASQGYFDWTISQSWTPKPTAGNEGRYKIMIGDVNSQATGITSSSNYFTINNTPVIQPTITVTSPNGGETWKVGETHDITWTSTDDDLYVIIKIVGFPDNSINSTVLGGQVVINRAVRASAGKYSWTIPSSISSSLLGKENAKIQISTINTTGKVAYGESGFFSISASQPSITCSGKTFANIDYYTKGTTSNTNGDSFTDYCVSGYTSYNLRKGYCGINTGGLLTTAYLCQYGCNNGACNKQATPIPTITITSPNEGEQWHKGSTYNITWTSSGVDKINIVTGAFGAVQIGMNVSASSGSYSWTIPSTVTPGTYAITIYDVNNASSVVATGKTFSIVAQ